MRAAVGLMLSDGIAETVMSRADYEQTAFHHRCLLVLLRGVGPSKPRSLQSIFDKVRRVNNIKINDSSGLTRDIWIRYIHDHPVENNDWGDFQTHRRLLGLVTFGKFETQTELNELSRQHESLKVRYVDTLLETRALFFGPATKLIKSISTDLGNGDLPPPTTDYLQTKHETSSDNRKEKQLQDEYITPSIFKSQAFFYREKDPCLELESQIIDFVNALFWKLESIRLKRGMEKPEIVSLLYAPYEKRDFVGLDTDSRNSRKRCIGRSMKNLADLSLQTGLIEDGLTSYHNSVETLNSINDALWLGAAEEGLCVASAILLFAQSNTDTDLLNKNTSHDDSLSTPISSDKLNEIVLTESILSQNIQKPTKSTSSTSLNAFPGTSAAGNTITITNSPPSTLSNSIVSNVNTQRYMNLPENILKPNEIGIHYRNAIINYSKYRHAAIIESEAALKAARVCIQQNRPLDVAMFLQNLLYIRMEMRDQDRCKLFEVIIQLYKRIGYTRKAAFFQRLAALKHVQPGNKNPDWSQTYRLLLESFTGYILYLDPLVMRQNKSGWPSLQIEIVQHLIAAAIRLGLSALATRHMTFLLQTQWNNMNAKERNDMAVQLENLSAQCEGSPVPLVLQDGNVIPPANLTDLPYCLDISVKDLPLYLRPQRIKIIKADNGPFLFTPIHLNSIDLRDKDKDKNKIGFSWVQNDLCDVTISLKNPLPFELVVSDMRLLTTGTVFESIPQTITLQPNIPTQITLQGTPMETGQLEIQGYSTHALGVKSNCRMNDMDSRHLTTNFLVDIIPPLPKISVKISNRKNPAFIAPHTSDVIVAYSNLTLFNGESAFCLVTISNDSNLPVEHVEIAIHSNVELETQKKIFKIDEQDIQSKLPLKPNETIEFMIKIYGDADFIIPAASQKAASLHSGYGTSSHMANRDNVGGRSQSLQHSLLSDTANLFPKYSPHTNDVSCRNHPQHMSFRSISSAGDNSLCTFDSYQVRTLSPTSSAQHVETQFCIKYSGGVAMEAGYCRQYPLYINLELISSVQITVWDILPAEIPSQFYLVLDISNLTEAEMSLNYAKNKNILIEARESCRVPIPVDRCSLEQMAAAWKDDVAHNLEQENLFQSQMLSFENSACKLCSKHIAERVKINWCLTGTEIQGIASLRGIVVNPSMIDLATVSPVQWTISIYNTPVQPQSEVVCTVGKRVPLRISMCNQSLEPLKNLELKIKFYQDLLNGMENYNVDTRVAVSGPNKIFIPLLPQNESVQHECSVIFFTTGRFKTNIQCCTKLTSIMATDATSSPTMAAITIATEYKPSNIPDITITSAINTSSMLYSHDQQEHMWKFIPSIDIKVAEQ